jgi:hypothetical protein
LRAPRNVFEGSVDAHIAPMRAGRSSERGDPAGVFTAEITGRSRRPRSGRIEPREADDTIRT